MSRSAWAADALLSTSYLEWAFLRWVLSPALLSSAEGHVVPQRQVEVAGHRYLTDYDIVGDSCTVTVELDGFAFHSSRGAFTYDRMRQNDLQATGRRIVRFSYDAIRTDTARCVAQLQAVCSTDPALAQHLDPQPSVEVPDMEPDPMHALGAPPTGPAAVIPAQSSYFDGVRTKINMQTLRLCQKEAFSELASYYGRGGADGACVMSVGAGKTALGVAAALGFTRRRALVVTPGNVIKGTFDRALDHTAIGNSLYGLPGGALIPGCRPPVVRTLDRDSGAIRSVTRAKLLACDIVVTNFHSLGKGDDPDDLLSKLAPGDIDFIVVDEAHIAASDSYQRLFNHFADARTLLLSACFQRLDGKPIEADVVYRYRLIDSIADGNAKNMRVHRFAPDTSQTTYEMVWPDGSREEFVGRQALEAVLTDERKLARITAKSTEPIRQVMRTVRAALDAQEELLHPVKPRVLFAALGERHAEQLATLANEHGIPSGWIHHAMPEGHIRRVRGQFESDTGNLQGLVQLKMLGQGYDFPPICVVVPMRPYGSFSEFYQFVGRGIRVLHHPALTGRVGPEQQNLDVVYHAELGLDDHIATIYAENDMDPITVHDVPPSWTRAGTDEELPGTRGHDTAEHPDLFVMFEHGVTSTHVVHDADRVDAARKERERAAMAQRYAEYAATSDNPVAFDQYVEVMRQLHGTD